ncbi:TIGR00266 family protein [Crocosphaera sp. XPORK-15E]|uniref:TIGR00266 family protein n=1 Tax=Crocosphaera sp. XPORK-15E TaxID=3110247 RepID=UPI002B205CA9|nr:TIGR00266 family protein [Crocosphaera sp. XPORK-15E]MEA5533176.1 TIGR00266 family protein [Crocosphaera sp. XPORK-15E]
MVKSQGINYQIENTPEAAVLILQLKPEQNIFIRTATLAARDASIEIGKGIPTDDLSITPGFSSHSYLSINEVQALKIPGSIYLSPDILGDIKHYQVTPEKGIIIQIFAFLACSHNVQLRLLASSMIKQFSERDSFFFHLVGIGELWASFYGNIQEILVEDNYLIQVSYLVAFEDTLNYEIKSIEGLDAPGIHSGNLGNYNIFFHFQGQGKLWIQSRYRYAFLDFFAPFIH